MSEMEKQFNRIAREYDSGRRKFIPCFDQFYGDATEFIAANCSAPRRILDLGAGTGLLTDFYRRHFPAAQYVLVDVADAMLQIARERFAGMANVDCRRLDYTVELPEGEFNLIVSALSIHHLEDSAKRELFQRIFDRLPPGGMFVNYDQFCAATPEMNAWFERVRLDRLLRTGISDDELACWRERRQLDRECAVGDELAMLRTAGFPTAECVFSQRNFAVIAARKTPDADVGVPAESGRAADGKIAYRLLTAGEIPQLSHCVRHLADYHNQVKELRDFEYPLYDVPGHLASLRRRVASGDAVVLAVFANGKISGFAQISVQGKAGDLEYLFLEPECRKHGCGKRLMDWALAEFARRGATHAHLRVVLGNPARTFYEHCGFVPRALAMVKKLDCSDASQN